MARALLAAGLTVVVACGSAQSTGDPARPGPAEGDKPGAQQAGDPDAPPDEPPALPAKVVPPAALEAQRVRGTTEILPDPEDAAALQAAGKRAVVVFKLCLDETGAVSQARLLKSSGRPAYDQKIERTMRDWAYRPFLVNNVASPVCTAITFIYQPDGAAPDPAGNQDEAGTPPPPPPPPPRF